MTAPIQLQHHRLDAWHAAVELASLGRALSHAIPRGDKDLADQLRRAATAPALLIAEGANRSSAGEKRQRYTEARGEAGEAAAAAELAATLGLVPADDAMAVVAVAARVAAMASKLAERFAN